MPLHNNFVGENGPWGERISGDLYAAPSWTGKFATSHLRIKFILCSTTEQFKVDNFVTFSLYLFFLFSLSSPSLSQSHVKIMVDKLLVLRLANTAAERSKKMVDKIKKSLAEVT